MRQLGCVLKPSPFGDPRRHVALSRGVMRLSCAHSNSTSVKGRHVSSVFRLHGGVALRCARFSGTHCRVLHLESVETGVERENVDAERLAIEVAFARVKAQDVLDLTQVGSDQLKTLLGSTSKQKKQRSKRTAVPKEKFEKLKICKQLQWDQNSDGVTESVFVKTTRPSNANSNKKRTEATQPPAESLPNDLWLPVMRQTDEKVLTSEEEKEFAYKVQRFVAIAEVRKEYKTTHGRFPIWEEVADIMGETVETLRTEYRVGKDARQALIARNLRLVMSMAGRIRPVGAEYLDAVVDGVMGLTRAIEKFDPSKGFKLSTYAHWWIRQTITRSYRSTSRVVTIPSSVTDEFRKVMQAQEEFIKDTGVLPTDGQLSEVISIKETRVSAVRNAYRHAVRLDESLDDGGDTRGDLCADDKIPSPHQDYANRMMKQDLELVLSTLPEKESQVVRLRYGLEDGNERTLEDVGHLFHVSRERVRQIEAKALRTLRRRCGTLEEYTEPEPELVFRGTAAAHRKAP